MKIFLDADSQMQIHIQMHIRIIFFWQNRSLSNAKPIGVKSNSDLDNTMKFQNVEFCENRTKWDRVMLVQSQIFA